MLLICLEPLQFYVASAKERSLFWNLALLGPEHKHSALYELKEPKECPTLNINVPKGATPFFATIRGDARRP